MGCPNCGLPTLADQRFCRSCGANLERITHPLNRSDLASHSDSHHKIITRDKHTANTWVFWGFTIMLIGAAIGVIGKKLMHEDIVTVVGVLASLAGMFLMVYPYISPSRRDRHEGMSRSEPALPEQTPKPLPAERNIDYIPSVTERTTDLLKSSTDTRPDAEQYKRDSKT